MSEINTKMRVTGINEYKNAMKQGQQAVKTLDAELKLNEAQYKASGDAEDYMQKKSKLLTDQIKQQKQIVDNATKALKQMEKDGVSKTSAAYQKMQQDLANAQTSLLNMESAMNGAGSAADKMGQKASTATSSLQSIDKRVTFASVIDGINRITAGLENVINRAGEMAKRVWEEVAGAASWADEENTLAAMYGIDVETLQQMQNASKTIDTSVDTIIAARDKLAKAMHNGSGSLKDLGIETLIYGESDYSHNKIVTGYRDIEDVFWDVGDALLNCGNEVDRNAISMDLFGKSWKELMPIFLAGRQTYEETVKAQSYVTEENVNKLNDFDDALQNLDTEFKVLKNTVLAALAPAFTTLSDKITEVLRDFNEFLKTEEGQAKLQELSDAVGRLFDSISNIDFSTAMETVTNLIDDLVAGLTWLSENQGSVVNGLKAIAGTLVALKVSSSVLQFLNLLNGAKNLFGGGGAGDVAGEIGKTVGKGGLAAAAKALGTKLPIVGLGIGALYTADRIWASDNPNFRGDNPTEAYIEAESHLYARTQAANKAQETQIRLQDYMKMLSVLSTEYEKVFTTQGSPFMEHLLDTLSPETLTAMENVLEAYGGGSGYIPTGTASTLDRILEELGGVMIIPSEPELVPEAHEVLQMQLDEIPLTVPVYPQLVGGDTGRGAGGGGGMMFLPDIGYGDFRAHANGLPWVPFDGYPAILHRGERVLTATENNRYMTNNSNLFVEHMHMNGGLSARALADQIAAAQRRMTAGYGS